MSPFWTLDADRNPVPCGLREWGETMESPARIVDKSYIGTSIEVSTVFLGIDHGWGNGRPVLFETMVFGGELDEAQWRYCTWSEAEEGHKRAMAQLMARYLKAGAE